MERDTKPTRKKIGRPKLPRGQGKRAQLNVRVTDELKNNMDAAAKASGRSVAQEVEFRLEQSFMDDAALARSFGGKHLMALMQLAGTTAAYVERQMGYPAHEDPASFRQVMVVVKEAMEVLGGQKMKDDPGGIGAKAIKAALQFAGMSDQELTTGIGRYDRSVISLVSPKDDKK